MPQARFFALFRLFVRENFFDRELCARLREEMRSGGRAAATIRTGGASYAVDPAVRSAKWVEVSDSALCLTDARLREVRPEVQAHFQVSLDGCQRPQFLAYRPGDFYRPHRDNSQAPDASQTARERRISVILFLNSPSEEPAADCYGGGALTFYGLMNRPGASSVGFPLIAAEGLLIAFPSSLLHEVAPVSHGERYTIASWYR